MAVSGVYIKTCSLKWTEGICDVFVRQDLQMESTMAPARELPFDLHRLSNAQDPKVPHSH